MNASMRSRVGAALRPGPARARTRSATSRARSPPAAGIGQLAACARILAAGTWFHAQITSTTGQGSAQAGVALLDRAPELAEADGGRLAGLAHRRVDGGVARGRPTRRRAARRSPSSRPVSGRRPGPSRPAAARRRRPCGRSGPATESPSRWAAAAPGRGSASARTRRRRTPGMRIEPAPSPPWCDDAQPGRGRRGGAAARPARRQAVPPRVARWCRAPGWSSRPSSRTRASWSCPGSRRPPPGSGRPAASSAADTRSAWTAEPQVVQRTPASWTQILDRRPGCRPAARRCRRRTPARRPRRLLQRQVRGDGDERVQLGLQPLDPLQKLAGDLDRRELARLVGSPQLGRASPQHPSQKPQRVALGQRRAAPRSPSRPSTSA